MKKRDHAKTFSECTGLANVETLCLCWLYYKNYEYPKTIPLSYTIDLRYALKPKTIIVQTLSKNFCKELIILTSPGHHFTLKVAPIDMIIKQETRWVIDSTSPHLYDYHIFTFKEWVNSNSICWDCDSLKKYIPNKI